MTGDYRPKLMGHENLDPNEKDPYLLWAAIAQLRAAIKGPDGYDSWQAAATDERARRVRAEANVANLRAVAMPAQHTTFQLGQTVRKKSGSQWEGEIVGFYSTTLTPEGYAVESSTHKGSVQIYPASALEAVPVV